ncbi:MAG: ATP-binding protein [Oscillospiraceae bacterium]|nr:ATP-binding protein [Oscillospiraceae bacterium]
MGLAASVLLLIYAVSQEKKTAVEEELKETRHIMKLEKAHYAAVEQRREELASIRRDFSGRLEAVVGLTRSGEDDAVRGLIAALSEKIGGTRERPYCDIPVINAVLTEKTYESAAAGIELTIDLSLPRALAVEPMHLCSIFSNILDNAITACKNPMAGDRPVIRLSSLADGDYLFIKVVNPSGEPRKNALPGHGYGMRILSELAKQYGGGCQTEYSGGEFTAVVSLLAAESAAAV